MLNISKYLPNSLHDLYYDHVSEHSSSKLKEAFLNKNKNTQQTKKPRSRKKRGSNMGYLEKKTKMIDTEALTNISNITFYPVGNQSFIEGKGYRVPTFVIIGAMKAGTTALTMALQQHPDIQRNKDIKEVHFFDGYNFNPKKGNQKATLHHLYSVLPDHENGFSEKMYWDSTPRYIVMSDMIPEIKRLCPWIKIMILLRNPTERLFSHYVMTLNAQKSKRHLSFEQYIQQDLDHLKQVGLFPYSTKTANQDRDDAWLKYIHEKKFYSQILVGRGLYSLQIRQWLQYFDRSSVLIMNYSLLKQDQGKVIMFNRAIDFLGLKKIHLKLNDNYIHNKGNYTNMILTNETRKMLDDFYAPYNKELASLIGDEWNGIWE